jgi:hypothetical protein
LWPHLPQLASLGLRLDILTPLVRGARLLEAAIAAIASLRRLILVEALRGLIYWQDSHATQSWAVGDNALFQESNVMQPNTLFADGA